MLPVMVSLVGRGKKITVGVVGGGVGLALPLSGPGNPFSSLCEAGAETEGESFSPKPVTMVQASPPQQGWYPGHTWMQAGRWINHRPGAQVPGRYTHAGAPWVCGD